MERLDSKRLYLTALLLTAVLLVLVRLFVLPLFAADAKPSIAASGGQIIDSLLGATVAAASISILVGIYLTRGARKAADAIVVEPAAIGAEVEAAALAANTWSYRGHTGRYFRTAVLPLLERRAAEQGQFISISVQLLDPDDEDLMDFFVDYRKLMNPGRADHWTRARAQGEIAATLLAVLRTRGRFSRITCRVYLSSNISALTLDLSDQTAVVTRERAGLSALKYPKGSTFYDSTVEDVELSHRRAREIDLHASRDPVSLDALTVTNTLTGLGIMSTVDDAAVTVAIEALAKPVNPYA